MLVTLGIPPDGKCFLKTGQKVNFNDPFIEKKDTVTEIVPAARILGIAPPKIFNHLRKFVGENVATGDLIAVNKGVISSKKIYSRFDGIIQEIDHHSGNITIQTTGDKQSVQKTFFKGEITEVKKNEIVINLSKAKSYPLVKAAVGFGGEVSYFNATAETTVRDLSGKILVADKITPYLQSKSEALGVGGYVLLMTVPDATDLPVAQLKNIDDYKKITDQHFPYCLVSKTNSTIYFYP